MIRVFVYGTLRRNERNHHYIETARFIGKASSLRRYSVITRTAEGYEEGYPVAIEDHTGEVLHGEIYEIDENTLAQLDILEDYPREYDRKTENFRMQDSKAVQALIYSGKEETHDV